MTLLILVAALVAFIVSIVLSAAGGAFLSLGPVGWIAVGLALLTVAMLAGTPWVQARINQQ